MKIIYLFLLNMILQLVLNLFLEILLELFSLRRILMKISIFQFEFIHGSQGYQIAENCKCFDFFIESLFLKLKRVNMEIVMKDKRDYDTQNINNEADV